MKPIGHLEFLKAVKIFCLILAASLPFARAQQVVEDGTEAHPFLIESKQELLDFHDCMCTNADFYFNGSTFVTSSCSGCIKIFAGGKLEGNQRAYFRLEADIIINADTVAMCEGTKKSSWVDWTPMPSFSGVFDGNYHTISGIFCKLPSTTQVGFFKELSSGIVRNLGITNSYIEGKGYTGGFAGDVLDGSLIEHCFYWGAIEGNDDYCGGIGGRNFNGSIIRDCYTTGNFHTTGHYAGNIVGRNNGGSTLQNCYSSMWSSSETGLFGGICGLNDDGASYSNCYYDQQMTHNTGTVNIGTKKLTREMATASFTSLGAAFIPENGMYPKLTGFNYNDNPAARLSVAPIYLHAVSSSNCENMDNIHSDFTLGVTPAGVNWEIDSWNDAAVLVTADSVHLNRHGIADLTLTISGMTRLWTIIPKLWPYLGSEQNPYTIANISELTQFRNGINSGQRFKYKRMWVYPAELDTIHWLQIADIDLSSVSDYTPCGTSSYPFRGFYDGGHYKIDNMKITSGGTCNYKGFFGYTRNANIKNLDFNNPDVTGCSYVSILCGYSVAHLVVDSCHIYGGKLKATGSNSYCGAICGAANYTSSYTNTTYISHCTVDSITITGQYAYTGGICGYSGGSSYVGYINISDCSVSRTPITASSYAGGICGYTYTNSSITNCTFEESAINSNSSYVGGICGYMWNYSGNSSHRNYITNCIVRSTPIKGSSYVGGICGQYYGGGTISNCSIQDTTITGSGNYIGGICGEVYTYNSSDIYIKNCINRAKSVIMTGNYNYIGGICGGIDYNYARTTYIQNCKNYSYVSGYSYVGGILGRGSTYSQSYSQLTYCYNAGQIKSTSNYAGGVIGNYGIANYCINTGVVRGTNYVGGIGGQTVNASYSMNTADVYCNNYGGGIAYDGTAQYCANYGNVIPKNPNVPQITEYGVSSSASYSYNVGRIFGIENARTSGNNGTQVFYDDDFVGDQYFRADGTGLQQSQMLSASSSITGLGTNWIYEDGRYPRLKWTNDTAWARPIAETASWPVKLATEPEDANNVRQGVKLYGCDNGVTWRVEEPAAGERGGCIFTGDLESLTCSSNAITPTVDATCQGITVVAAVYGDSVIKRVMLRPFVTPPTDTLTIDNLEELQAFRDSINSGEPFHWKGHYVPRFADSTTFLLTSDITMPTSYWTPIGNNYTVFRGVFLGGDHTIDKLVANTSYSGLFCHVNGRVQDLNFTNVNLTGSGNYKGAVCAYLRDGKVSNITVSGSMYGSYMGSVVGWSDGIDTILNCVNNCASSSSSSYVGGILGYATGNTYLADCENKVNLNGSYVGGIVGYCTNHSGSALTGKVTAERCSNEGNIGGSYMGGILGYDASGAGSKVLYCNNKGTVSGSYYAGGIAGYGNNITASYCKNEKKITSSYYGAAGIVYGGSGCVMDSCINYGDVVCTSSGSAAGIGGNGSSCRATNCINYGTVSATGSYASGIVGGTGTSCTVSHCTNFGDVTSTSSYAAGILTGSGTVTYCDNKGSLVKAGSGSNYYTAAGIVSGNGANSTVNYCNNEADVEGLDVAGIVYRGSANHCSNFGDVKGHNNATYVAGISGYSGTSTYCYNVGTVTAMAGNSNTNRYAGGICGSGGATYCYNAGQVFGFNSMYVGGITGNGSPQYCYNSNTIRSSGTYKGSIAGTGTPQDCYYDKQMSPMGGVNGNDNTGNRVVGRSTTEMLGSELSGLLGTNATWTFTTNYYPQLTEYANTPPSLSSVMPVLLQNDETALRAYSSFYMKGCEIGEWHIQQGAALRLDTASALHQCEGSVIGFGIIKLGAAVEGRIYRRDRLLIGISEDAPYIVKSLAEMQNFRTVINQNGFYNMADSTYHLTLTSEDSTHIGDYAEIQDGGLDLYFKLIVDLDMAELPTSDPDRNNWTPVGAYSTSDQNKVFQGTFMGDNHTISHLTINSGAYKGLFGRNNIGEIRDLTISESKMINSGDYRGLLCGSNFGGALIKNCSVENNKLQQTSSYNGVLCGENRFSTIHNCHSLSDTIMGSGSYIGSICGYQNVSVIDTCYAEGLYLPGTCSTIGGICGRNETQSVIYDCYVKDSYIHATGTVGGICGYNYNSYTNDGIRNCSTINVEIDATGNYVGGIVGSEESGRTYHCTTTEGSTKGNLYVGGICGYKTGGSGANYNVEQCTNENTVEGSTSVGGIVGWDYNYGAVTSCTNRGAVTASGDKAGGIVGWATYNLPISNCINYAPVNGTSNVGGVVGNISQNGSSGSYGSVSITNSHNRGHVTGTGNCVGGIVGYAYYYSYMNQCYNAGNVTSNGDYVGGLAGDMYYSYSSYPRFSFNTGIVTGKNRVGGLFGRTYYSYFQHCYNAGIVKGISQVGGLIGVMENPYSTSSYGYNIGWVEGASMVGATCGYTTSPGSLTNLFYDTQMCFYGPVANNAHSGSTGKLTREMLGNNLSTLGTSNWTFTDGMYPRLKALANLDASIASTEPVLLPDDVRADGLPIDNYPNSLGGCDSVEWKRVEGYNISIDNCSFEAIAPERVRIGDLIGGDTLKVVHLVIGILNLQSLEITDRIQLKKFRDLVNSGETFYYDPILKEYRESESSYYVEIPPYGEGKEFVLMSDIDLSLESEDWVPIGNGKVSETKLNMKNGSTSVICGLPIEFYDNGGPTGEYSNSVNYTHYFASEDATTPISIRFLSGAGEGCCDYLTIYNGPNTSSPVLLSGSGGNLNSIAGRTFTSTGSTLTVSFHSDGSVVGAGWSAVVYCEGADEEQVARFKGTFNGNGHTISGMKITEGTKQTQGLFGYLEGVVKNLKMENTELTAAGENHGSLVGYNHGTVTNCGSTMGVVQGTKYVGGLVGRNVYDQMEDCYNGNDVTGSQYVGGIAGYCTDAGILTRCFNYGVIKGTYNGAAYVGGIVGQTNVELTYSYNTGIIIGKGYTGGIVGYNGASTNVHHCYNAGFVDSLTNNYIGSVVGNNSWPSQCFYDKQMSPVFKGLGGSGSLGSDNSGYAYPYETAGPSSYMSGTNPTIKSSLGTTYWTYSEGMYPRLKSMDSLDASIVSTKIVSLPEQMKVNHIVFPFSVATGDGVEWYRYGYGNALNLDDIAEGTVRLTICGDDTLQVMKNGDRRLVPFYVKALAAETLVDTACNGFYIWAVNGRVYTETQTATTLIPVAEGCDSVLKLDITVPDPLTLTINSHNHDCFDDNVAYAEAVPGGGFGEGIIDRYLYYWTMEGVTDTISTAYRISDTTTYFGGKMPAGTYHLSMLDKLHPACEISRDVTITEPTELTASITGFDHGCYNQADGFIALEVAGGTLPYTISWSGASSGSQSINTAAADTIRGLNDGSYNVWVTDNHSCRWDLPTTTLTGNDEEHAITAMGVDKMYDGVAVNLGRYILQIGTGTPDTIASGDTKTLADGAILTVSVTNTNNQKDYTTGTVNEIATWTLTKDGVDASCRYNVTLHSSPVEIRKRDVVLTSATDMKEWDGTALENHTVTISGSGFAAPDDTLSTTVTGSQTDAGFSTNTFTYELNSSVNPDNYSIEKVEGTLTVTPQGTLVLVAASGTKMYDGTALENPTFTCVGLHAGDTVYATVVGSQLNAGSSANAVDTVHNSFDIKGIADNLSHKADYTSIMLKDGTLTVTPRSVTLTTSNDSKVYDGTPLSRPEISVSGDGVVTGELTWLDTVSITNYGSIANRIDTSRGANYRVENYNITLNPGTLSISKRPLTVTGETRTLSYTGTEQRLTAYSALNLLSTDTITGITYLAKGTDVNEDPGYLGAFTPNNTSSVVIKNKVSGVVVTDNYSVDALVPGRLYITGNPLPLVIISNSQSFTYDRQPHTYHSYTVLYNEESMPCTNDTNFVLSTGDRLTIHPAGPGRGITHVLESGINDFTYDLENSLSYVNKDTIKGTISITKRLVNLRSPNYTIVYDGVTKIPDVSDLVDARVERSGMDFVPGEGVTCSFNPSIQRKDVGSSLNVFSYTFKVNTSASDYLIDTTYGVLTVTPARLTLTAVDTFKYYGDENPQLRYTLSGFVNNEDTTHNAPFIGSARPVLSTTATTSSNAGHYPINVDITGVSFANYEIEVHEGDLAVRYRPVTITAYSKEDIVYDGSVHTWEENVQADGSHFYVTPGQLREGDSVRYISISGNRTVAGTTLIELSNARIWHFTPTDTTDVTLNYEPEYVPGNLTITPRTIKLKPFGYTHEFTGYTYNSDSTADPHYSIVDGSLAPKDTIVTIQINGSRSAVGETPFVIDSLSILIVNKDSVHGNYSEIAPRYNMTAGYNLVLDTATLRITNRTNPWEITMQGICDTIIYDGNGHGVNGFVTDEFTFNGHTYHVTGLISKVENKSTVGVYPTTVTGTAQVLDADNNDVTSEFEVTTSPGRLVINKRPLELTAYGLIAEYDGRIHSSNDILWPRCRITGGTSLGATDVIHDIVTTGQISLPGTVPVHIVDTLVKIWNNANSDVTNNYDITVIDSSITILPRTVLFELLVRAAHDTVEYNSEIQSVTGFETLDFVVNDYHFTVDSVAASGASGEYVGYYKNSVTVTATDHVPHVFDEQNNDVTSQFHVTTKDDTLRIIQKPITITADDSTKMYNGTPLVDHGWNDHAPEPATNDYVASVEFTGSQTLVGTSNNVPSAAVIRRNVTDDDVTANYAITYVNGTLTVTPDTLAIVITSADHGWTFDGELHKDETYTVTYNGTAITADASGKKFELPTGDTVRITPTAAGVTYVSDNASNNNTFTYTIDHQNQYVADSIHTTFGTLSIEKKDLLITVNDTKQYDQSVLTTLFSNTTAVSTDELVSGDALTAGSVKTTSANAGIYTSDASTSQVDEDFTTTLGIDNYHVTYDFTQTITRGTGMVVTCPTATDTVKMYDGTELNPVATGSVPNSTTVTIQYKTATSDWSTTVPSITHVDDGPLAVEVRGVNENYDTAYCNYKLRITPRPIEMTAGSQEFVFDGDAHTYHVAHTTGTYHFVGTDTMDFQFDPASEITFVTDTIDNVITGATPTGTTQANDYTFTYQPGELTMVFGPAVPLTLTARDTAWVYDGTTHHFHSYTLSLNHGTEITVPASANGVYNFPHDIVLTVTFDPSSEIKDYSATGVDNKIASYTLMYGTADVSGAYDVTLVDGTLSITPRPTTITANDTTKEYDGTPLTENGWNDTPPTNLVSTDAVESVTVTGSQTVVGTSDNVPSNAVIKRGSEDVTQNYAITYANGTLEVTNNTKEIVITSASDSWVYDGETHTKPVYTVTYDGTNVADIAGSDGLRFELPTHDTITISNSFAGIKNFSENSSNNNTFDYTIQNLASYSNVSKNAGTLEITKRPVSLTANSLTVLYDGHEHTYAETDAPHYTIAPRVDEDSLVVGHTLVATMTGSRTNVGNTPIVISSVVISDASSNDVTANYQPSFINGSLTINPLTGVVVTIQEHGKEVVYNASDQRVTGYGVASINDPANQYTASDFSYVGPTSDTIAHGTGTADALHVYDMDLKATDFQNVNTNYDEVTFIIADSALYIYPIMNASSETTSVTCNIANEGTHNDGTATITVTGGRPKHDGMYGFAINGGTSEDFASPKEFSNLSAGHYTVVVTDSIGTTMTVEFDVDEPDALTAVITVPTDLCPNQGSYAVSVTAEHGTPTYSYNWSGATNVDATSTSVTQTLTNDCGTNYVVYVTVTDSKSCKTSATKDFTVEDNEDPTFTAPANLTICRVNGEISAPITVTGDVTDEADNCTTTLDATWRDIDTLPADNSGNRIIRREWVLEDGCGNIAKDTQNITVRPSILTDGNITFTCPDTTVTLKYGVCDTLLELPRTLINNMTDMTLTLDSTGHTHNHRYNVENSPYTITWTVTDECGDHREFTQIVTVKYPPCGGDYWVADGDGIMYPTVQVGCNCWTGRNARSTHYTDNTPVTPEGMQFPGTEQHPLDTLYGKLYTYQAATRIAPASSPVMPGRPTRATRAGDPAQVQGICPAGWHIPDAADFADLYSRYEEQQLKSTNATTWIIPGTDDIGFTLEPAGMYNDQTGYFENLRVKAYLWSYTPGTTTTFYACEIGSGCGPIEMIETTGSTGYSVRCVRDAE